MNKEKKKTIVPLWIKITIFAIIIMLFIAFEQIGEKVQNQLDNPIDLISYEENLRTGDFVYLDVELLTKMVAYRGNNVDPESWENSKYYIALKNDMLYLIELDEQTYNKLKIIQDYSYDTDKGEHPGTQRICGALQKIPEDLKEIIVSYYDEAMGEKGTVNLDNFTKYFGEYFINVKRSPSNIALVDLIIVYTGILLLLIFILIACVIIIKNSLHFKKKSNEK